ncbi:hypothetical protein LB577_27475 [Mesorhizobium sp. B283B1A]|uniref:hypothetical protein n=1 Tax=Mesorhizobium TaxID=68287 RepID=UPI001CD070A4|nr:MULTISPECIES: hypothetical protein [Mesorhizobium]MCA0050649.1 hypothetical protein [Mesorhizobium sp. B283B1A]UQS66919.1 hypothetical protein M5D98_11580 [Mesorhizobium opportunistum]
MGETFFGDCNLIQTITAGSSPSACLRKLLVALCVALCANAAYASSSTCPALTPNGHRLPAPPAMEGVDAAPDFSSLPAEGVPVELGDQARAVVAIYETGKSDGYGNISALDILSVGISQWNIGIGSFYDELLSGVPVSAFDLANSNLRDDLLAMRNFPAQRASIVHRWQKRASNDPLVAGIRRSVYRSLSAWLSSPPVVETQRRLTERDLNWAWKRSLAWRKAEKSSAPVSAALLATFYDLKVYNGGDLSGLWYANVAEFRQTHADATAILSEVANWLAVCEGIYHPEKAEKHRRLYSIKDLSQSVSFWQALARDEPARFTNDVNNLLVFGYLRAQRSVGSNGTDGFPGIYQADVLLRRGTEAVGEGFRGEKITLFN